MLINVNDKNIKNILSKYSNDSYALAIVKNNEIVYQKISGYADINNDILILEKTNFRLASVSKQFMAVAIMFLVQESKLSLENTLSDFFDGFSGEVSKISIHNLLCHNSGLKQYEDLISSDIEYVYDNDVLDILKNEPELLFSIGGKYDYNNGAYCLLRLIIEKVSSQKIDVFLQNNIFTPLGMNNTFLKTKEVKNIPDRAYGYSIKNNKIVLTDQDLTSRTVGDGGVYSSLSDLKKWPQVFTTNIILSSESISQILQKHSKTKSGFYGYALNIVDIENKQHVYHGGSSIGFHTSIYNIFKDDVSVIFLSNRTAEDGSVISREIISLLYK